MESKMTLLLLQHLLESVFPSKKALADGIDIPYRTLLKMYAGKGDKRTAVHITNRVLRYCIENQIRLDTAFEQIH